MFVDRAIFRVDLYWFLCLMLCEQAQLPIHIISQIHTDILTK